MGIAIDIGTIHYGLHFNMYPKLDVDILIGSLEMMDGHLFLTHLEQCSTTSSLTQLIEIQLPYSLYHRYLYSLSTIDI